MLASEVFPTPRWPKTIGCRPGLGIVSTTLLNLLHSPSKEFPLINRSARCEDIVKR